MRCALLLILLPYITFCSAVNSHVDFDQACWTIRSESVALNPSLVNNTSSRCASQYALFPNDPALPVIITLPECLARWPGWQMSQVSQLSQWVGPLVGFLLPALVFVLTIPRNYRMPRGEKLFDRNLFLSACWLIAAFALMIIDIISWIIAVFGLAGLMMVGAIDESLKDWMILKEIEREVSKGISGRFKRRQAAYAIALTLIGTFLPRSDEKSGDDLVDKVITGLCDSEVEDSQRNLHLLLDHQSSYGIQIGAPVVFYLGAYGYALFDASSKLGDNDTAHAIAFGLWYGIVVLTATACCCVLGMTRPATLEAIFGRVNHAHLQPIKVFAISDSPYHTVSLWFRGDCVRSWTNISIVGPMAPSIPTIEKILNSRMIRLFACILTILGITTVCSLAISISYFTPRLGFGCRATTMLCYAGCQIVLIICWFCYNFHQGQMRTWVKWPVYILGSICIAFAVFCSIGGTIMQLLGVYRNCVCKAGLGNWIITRRGFVSLATDTKMHRDYAHLWIKIGSAGIAYIGVSCVVGWGYYMKMKEKCRKQINALETLQ